MGWAMALALLLPIQAAASSEYVVLVEPNTFQALPIGGGTVVAVNPSSSGGDDPFSVNLPFPVQFFGNTFQSLRMSPDGWVSFDMGQGSAWSSRSIPSTDAPRNLIAVWWWDTSCAPGAMKSQTMGTPGQRTFVLEWTRCPNVWDDHGSKAHFQLWLFEGSTTIEGHYNNIEAGTWSASIGIQDHDRRIGYSPVTCNGSCGASAFPAGKKVIYAQSADLAVTAVSTDPVIYSGVAIDMEATVTNKGGKPAGGATLRFWLSRDERLSGDDTDLGWAPEVHDLAPGQSGRFTLRGTVPADLELGRYYLLAQTVIGETDTEVSLGNNVGAAGPLILGAPTPDFAAVDIAPHDVEVQVGDTLEIEWTVANAGNLDGDVEYWIVLSRNDFISSTDYVAHRGVVTIPWGQSIQGVDVIDVPEAIRTGSYRVGILLDPENRAEELSKSNNASASEESVVLFAPAIEILTPNELEVQSTGPVSLELEAWGGDGFFEWSIESGTLPGGLSLHTERDHRGRPLFTKIVGAPTAKGRHTFGLRVRSADWTTVDTFSAVVGDAGTLLQAVVSTIQSASFQVGYEARLIAVGGVPPYRWSLVDGKLPAGLTLFDSGLISGIPGQAGTFSFTAEVTDSVGARDTTDVQITVAPPPNLTCGKQALPQARVGVAIEPTSVLAAGGKVPYVFSTTETRRLASGSSDMGETLLGPPPGLSLSSTGEMSGTPAAAGRYVWIVKVVDGNANDARCLIEIDVGYDQGPSILTTALPDGFVDTPYNARLEQFGADPDTATWSLLPGNKLPGGLTLTTDGRITGLPSLADLEGADQRIFAFVVQVRDDSQLADTRALSIRIHRDAGRSSDPNPLPRPKEGGCQSSTGLAWTGLLVAGYAVVRRRKAPEPRS